MFTFSIIIALALVLLLALTAIVVLLLRRRQAFKAAGGHTTEAYLNDYHGYTSEASYKLHTKPTLLGRVAGQDSQKLNCIVIPETTIGRRHALIDYKDCAYWISDQGSINGTFVNDRQITSEVRLKHGDKVRLHKYEFEFIIPGGSAAVASGSSFSDQEAASVEAAAALQEVQQAISQADAELDFDFAAATEEAADAQEATVTEDDPVDETLLPIADSELFSGAEADTKDETLMPGSFEDVNDDSNNEQAVKAATYENLLDLTSDGAEDKKP